jgi:hypothetical protein
MKIVWGDVSPLNFVFCLIRTEIGIAEAGHFVEHGAADFCFDLSVGQSLGMKAPADDGFVSINRGFDEAAPAISGTTLPSKPSVSFDRTRMGPSGPASRCWTPEGEPTET